MSRFKIYVASLGFFSALLMLVSTSVGAQSLQAGIPVSISLPAQNYVTNYYIDVDSSAKQLNIAVNGTGGDLDLFVRFATPFPESPTPVSEDTLSRYSQYHSFSSTSSESISVLPSSRVPLTAGRWYIALINAANTSTTANLTATTFTTPQVASINIDFNSASTDSTDHTNDCDIAPWTDITAVSPVNGNSGTTLGQQRQNALKQAVQELTSTMQPPIAITVHACWAHLGGDANKATIAHASPVTFLLDEPTFGGYILPRRYTWYAITEAVRLGGASQCGLIGGPCGGVDNEEIEATFNEDIGLSTVIGGEPFYYGFTADTSGSSIDFISVATHELTHGLGFIGLANTDSTQGPIGAEAGIATDATTHQSSITYQNFTEGPYDDIYDAEVAIADIASSTYTPFMGYEVTGAGDSARRLAMTSGNGLRWSDPVAVNSTVNLNRGLPTPQNFPQLYAPNPIQNGSTLSHTVQFGDLMNAIYPFPPPRVMGLAAPMLAPLGWSNATATAPTYAQPIPSNWYDSTHGGHGFDFQLTGHDAVHGDTYILVLYTYNASGAPEWYFAQGNLVDGVFVAGLDKNGNTLLYSTYGSDHSPGHLVLTQQTNANVDGSVIVDFNQAPNSAACRNADRSKTPMLGVMSWTIGSDSGTWCMEPLVSLSQHASPDFNGHWFASSDSGWGMEILDFNGDDGSSSALQVLIYYPDASGLPTWAIGGGTLSNGAVTLIHVDANRLLPHLHADQHQPGGGRFA